MKATILPLIVPSSITINPTGDAVARMIGVIVTTMTHPACVRPYSEQLGHGPQYTIGVVRGLYLRGFRQTWF